MGKKAKVYKKRLIWNRKLFGKSYAFVWMKFVRCIFYCNFAIEFFCSTLTWRCRTANSYSQHVERSTKLSTGWISYNFLATLCSLNNNLLVIMTVSCFGCARLFVLFFLYFCFLGVIGRAVCWKLCRWSYYSFYFSKVVWFHFEEKPQTLYW